MTHDHGDDVEIEFAACRCRLPEEAAATVRERLKSAGLRVTEENGVGRTILVAKQVVTIPTRPPGNRHFAARRVGNTVELRLLEDVGDLTGETEASLQKALSMMVVPHHGSWQPRRQDTSMWLAVFDVRTFTRTGVELFVADDNDATSQLGVLAPALDVPQDAINMKPRPGWQGYGHPDLFPR